jgi:putative transposase
MPRPLRPQIENGVYHVGSRGVRKTPLYHEDDDRLEFLAFLAEVLSRYGWTCLAYCLMTNHFHLVVRTIEPTISRGMQWLNSRYCAYFNWRYGVAGHVLERRFWSTVEQTDDQLRVAIRYALRNPVRAGIAAEPGAWRWSSYAATAGAVDAPDFLDASSVRLLFGADDASGAAGFVEFVNTPSDSDKLGSDPKDGAGYTHSP